MHKTSTASNNSCGVKHMRKKQETPAVHDLRDAPVPPVKGAITDPMDALPDPRGLLGRPHPVQPEDSISFDTWL